MDHAMSVVSLCWNMFMSGSLSKRASVQGANPIFGHGKALTQIIHLTLHKLSALERAINPFAKDNPVNLAGNIQQRRTFCLCQ